MLGKDKSANISIFLLAPMYSISCHTVQILKRAFFFNNVTYHIVSMLELWSFSRHYNYLDANCYSLPVMSRQIITQLRFFFQGSKEKTIPYHRAVCGVS